MLRFQHGVIPPLLNVCEENMDAIRAKAYRELQETLVRLQKAVANNDTQEQLISLTQAINALQDAKQATVDKCGGLMQ
jgi:hypothetical protein